MSQSPRDPITGKFVSKSYNKLSRKQEEVLLRIHKRVTVCLIEHYHGHDVTMKLYNKKKSGKFNPKSMFFHGEVVIKQNVNEILKRLEDLGSEENVNEIEKVLLDQRHYKSGNKREWSHEKIAEVGAEFLKHHNEDHIGIHEWYNSQGYDICWSTFLIYMLRDYNGHPDPLKRMPV